MLAGANLLEEGKWREASVQAFATAVSAYPDDTETLASAGEGSLEYGRCKIRGSSVPYEFQRLPVRVTYSKLE